MRSIDRKDDENGGRINNFGITHQKGSVKCNGTGARARANIYEEGGVEHT